jgi:hypothetical protein
MQKLLIKDLPSKGIFYPKNWKFLIIKQINYENRTYYNWN